LRPTVVVADRCGFLLGTPAQLYNSKIGLFAFQDYGHGVEGSNFMCNYYVKPQIDEYFDGTFKLARAFAVLANTCLLIASLVLLISTCASLPKLILKAAGSLFIIGSVFTLLMFVVFASKAVKGDPHHRKAGWGVGFNVISMLLSVITGISTMRLQAGRIPAETNAEPEIESQKQPAKREQPKKPKRVMPPGAETIEETILPDGSRKYTTTKWHKDGSSTKTEEIISP
jgi:hypothetical protein